MEEQRLLYLYQRFVEHAASLQELAEFDEYLSGSQANQQLSALLDAEYIKQGQGLSDIPEESRQRVLQQLTSRFATRGTKNRQISLWPKLAIAAAVAIVVVGAGLFYFSKDKIKDQQAGAYANDIAPGKTGATLTLANGKKISLGAAKDGELAKEAGISIRKTAAGQIVYELKENSGAANNINTLSTAKGETYMLTLPDKSRVWMNAASTLTYAAALTQHGQRRVKLDGEAYFEIAKDKMHPFVVESNGQSVRVLGTHFNVNSYGDEPASRTTLLEGSVEITVGSAAEKLAPGQQALVKGRKIVVSVADVAEITAWKNGNFVFNGQDIPAIMRQLQRWYDIDVVYVGDVPQEKYYADISRFTNISQILKSLESAQGVHFQVSGRRVTVSK